MKQCPICLQNYDDTEYFCANDGSTLMVENNLNYIPFNNSEEILTQVVSRPFQSQAVVPPKSDSAKWLYLIIGVLAASLLGISIYLLMPNNKASKSEKANETQKNSESANENISNNPNTESVEQTTLMNVAPSVKPVSKKANKPNISTKVSNPTVAGNTQFTSDEEPIRPMNGKPSVDGNSQFTISEEPIGPMSSPPSVDGNSTFTNVPANTQGRPIKGPPNVKVIGNGSTNVKVMPTNAKTATKPPVKVIRMPANY